jgi:hypothetical protein
MLQSRYRELMAISDTVPSAEPVLLPARERPLFDYRPASVGVR